MRHDRFTLVLALLLPVVQLVLYGYALETRFQNLPAAVVNHDTQAAGRALQERIGRSPSFLIDGRVRPKRRFG